MLFQVALADCGVVAVRARERPLLGVFGHNVTLQVDRVNCRVVAMRTRRAALTCVRRPHVPLELSSLESGVVAVGTLLGGFVLVDNVLFHAARLSLSVDQVSELLGSLLGVTREDMPPQVDRSNGVVVALRAGQRALLGVYGQNVTFEIQRLD